MGGWHLPNEDIRKNMSLKKWIEMPGMVSYFTSKPHKFGFGICENSDMETRGTLPMYPFGSGVLSKQIGPRSCKENS